MTRQQKGFCQGAQDTTAINPAFHPCQIPPEGEVWGTRGGYGGVRGEKNGTAAIPTAGSAG